MTLREDLLPLVWRMVAGAALAAVVIGVAALFDLRIAWPVPLAVGLVVGAALWMIHMEADRDEPPNHPDLDLEADYALPHAQDMRVRRLEDAVHGAQPSRRMTARALGQVLGEVADERAQDPTARPLSRDLVQLIERARTPADADGTVPPVPPIDRRTLHRYLRELAAREERDR